MGRNPPLEIALEVAPDIGRFRRYHEWESAVFTIKESIQQEVPTND